MPWITHEAVQTAESWFLKWGQKPIKAGVLNKSFQAFAFMGLLFLLSCGQKAESPTCNDDVVEKVKKAMLCMQRYSWEQGTAMQGMLEIGDTTSLMIMARESVQTEKGGWTFIHGGFRYEYCRSGRKWSRSFGCIRNYRRGKI